MKTYLFTIMTITAVLTMSTVSWAIMTNSADLPPADGAYVSDAYFEYYTASDTITLEDPILGDFTGTLRQAVGDDEIETFDAVFTAVETSRGLGSVTLTGPVEMRHYDRLLSTTGVFMAEIISMSLSGDGLLIREDAALESSGQTQITDLGGGLYEIDSFFDVYTEISDDGGSNWDDCAGSTRIYLVPEPATIILFSLGGLILLRRRKA